MVRSDLAATASTDPTPTDLEVEKDWPNKGIYPGAAWGWQKPAPKQALVDCGKAHTAQQWILNGVQLVHWMPFVPAIMLAAHIFTHVDALQKGIFMAKGFHISSLQVTPLSCCYGHAHPCVRTHACCFVELQISHARHETMRARCLQVFCLMMGPLCQVFGSVMVRSSHPCTCMHDDNGELE